MQSLYIYLGKQLLVAGILMGYYWLALRDTKYHSYNRFYLIVSFLLSLLFPFVDLNWFAVKPPQNYVAQQLIYFIDEPGLVILPTQDFSWEKFVFYAALSVSFVLIAIMLFGVQRIYQLKKKSNVTSMDGFDFIETSAEEAPFSFFSNLFWRKDISLEDVTGKKILRHELTHIREFHTYDKMFVALFTHICWMNPFFWLLKKELSIIHEFIADEKSVQQSDAPAFAAMLLTTYDHQKFISSGQSFFYSSIKRRLNMLTSSKKTSYSYLRRILILPVAMGMMMLLSFTLSKKVSPHSTSKFKRETILSPFNVAAYKSNTANDTVPTAVKNKEYRVKSVGDSLIFLDAKTGKFLFKIHNRIAAPPPPPPLNLSQIPKHSDTVITVIGKPYKTVTDADTSRNKVITVVGHSMSEKEDQKNTSMVTFDKDIAMKALDNGSGVTITVSSEDGKNKYTIKKPVIKEQKLPEGLLYVVNGKRFNLEEFKKITPDQIKSINVLKGKSATAKYGVEGEQGVLEIELK